MNQDFLTAIPIINKIEDAGYEAYFVGGAVRDYLLEKDVHDVDIATSATPLELKQLFSNTVDVGIEHGTILVIYKGQGFEITTFRSEGDYQDFRHPQSVTFIRSLEEDLKRRDFTMNAIAMDKHGKLIDPFNGRAAIKEQRIETVGSARDRFQEDALRMMRALRFASQLGFHLERQTENELAIQSHLLKKIAIERVSAEMCKMLAGEYIHKAFQLALTTGMYVHWPSIFNQKNVLTSLLNMPIQSLTEVELWALGLYLNQSESPNDQLKQWKLPVKKIKWIVSILNALRWRVDNPWTDIQLYRSGKEVSLAVENIYRTLYSHEKTSSMNDMNDRYDRLPIQQRQDLAVSGNDLLNWVDKSPGPWMKEVLEELESAIINQEIKNERTEIKRWFFSCLHRLDKE